MPDFLVDFQPHGGAIRTISNIAFCRVCAHNMHPEETLSVNGMGPILERAFLYPGNKVCDACHVQADDDRVMIRTLVNMLVWNLAVLLVVLAIY
jgi:hypothetical protein